MCVCVCEYALGTVSKDVLKKKKSHLFPCVAAGFDLMDYFNVRDILGSRDDEGQSPYVRLGTMPIVQKTE